MIKIVVSFFSGAIICGLLVFTVRTIMPANAETTYDDAASENLTEGLAGLLPDIEGIYNQALTLPFKKAESKIYDEDIAEFYHELISSTGLGGTQAGD